MMAFSQNILCVPKHFWNVIWVVQKNTEVGKVVASQPAISLFLKSPPCKQNTLLEILSKIRPVDILFCQITTLVKVHVAFVFGLQNL